MFKASLKRAATMFAVAAFLTPFSPPAFADSTTPLYSHKAWEVRGVSYDNGTFACMAIVRSNGIAFSIWTSPQYAAELMFFDRSWSFKPGKADITLQIDRRARWYFNGAVLEANAVFFTLPDNDASVKFIGEVMRGNVLKLMNSQGKVIQRHSLAGSNASIRALMRCDDLVKNGRSGGNPFE